MNKKKSTLESVRAEMGNMAGAIGAALPKATQEQWAELEADMAAIREKAVRIAKGERQ